MYVRRTDAGDERLVCEAGFVEPDLGHGASLMSGHSDGAQAVAEFLHREVN